MNYDMYIQCVMKVTINYWDFCGENMTSRKMCAQLLTFESNFCQECPSEIRQKALTAE